jgi:hypothetical protein
MNTLRTLAIALVVAFGQAFAVGVLVAWAVTHDEFGPVDERRAFVRAVLVYCTVGFGAFLAPCYWGLARAAQGVQRRAYTWRNTREHDRTPYRGHA